MNAREKMDQALKRLVIPELRRLGFKGSFPHFRRISDHVDLLTFQFDKWGGGFVVEVTRGEVGGFTTYWGKHIPANKLKAWDLDLKHRDRLQPREGGGTDSWFRYDGFFARYDAVAKRALEIIRQYNWDVGSPP